MLQFRLRTLLISLAALSVLFGGTLAAWQHYDVYHRYVARDFTYAGPASPNGWQAFVHVEDGGPGWGADWYTIVEIQDAQGNVLAQFQEVEHYPYDRFRALADSLNWPSPDEFYCEIGWATREKDGTWTIAEVAE